MKRVLLILFTILSIAGSNAYSQISLDWVARYNGSGDSIDVATDIAVDNNGNVYVTGYSAGLLALSDYVTIKYDPSGNQLWAARYNGPSSLYDQAAAIVVDDSGNVFVTGYSFGLLSLSDYATIKYDKDGNEQWVRRYSGSLLGDDAANDIISDGSGGVIVTGYSTSLSGKDYLTVRYSSNGTEMWTKSYNGPGNTSDIAHALAKDDNGNLYVVGESNSGILNTSSDYAMISYDLSGNEQWSRRYNGSGNNTDKAYAIVVDNGDNIIITGETRSTGGSEDYTTVKYDTSGNLLWARTYNGTGNNTDKAYAIVVDNGDNVFVTGESKSAGNSEDYATIKYDQNGNQQWVRRYNGPANGSDKAYAIVIDNTDNVIVTGSSDSTSTSDDYTTVSYDQNGNQMWVARYNGPGNSSDKAYAIVVDNSDNIFITGGSRSGLLMSSEDYATIKYSKKTTVTGILNQVPLKYGISQNYPNPFNPSTNIEYNIAKKSFVKIVIYNYLGMALEEFTYPGLSAGTYITNWDAKGRASGIYFYKIIVTNINSGLIEYQETKKMMLIK